MSLQGSVRKGSQKPRIESFPLFHSSAADDAVSIAAIAGLMLDPWQEHVLRGALGERKDGRWSAFRTCLVVPRQNGKNAILEARELAGLLLFGESVITHTAHEFKTAYNSMIALMNRLKGCELIEYVRGGQGVTADTDIRDIDGFKTGNNPSITMKNENILNYASRTGGSGRGFTGDLVVLDEAYSLKASEMAALLPTMSAKSISGNPQVWFTSSAGMPDSDLLAGLREQGMSGEADRLAYYEWSAPDDADPADVDSWYEANPALGYRISEEYVRDEFDTFMSSGAEEEFKRERLGIWARLDSGSLFEDGVWESLRDPESVPSEQLLFGVDVAPARDSATISVVSMRPDGVVHVEPIKTDAGTDWLTDDLRVLQQKWKPRATVAIAGSATESLVPLWKRAGVRVHLLKFPQYKQACGTFFDLVKQGKVAHTGDAILSAAVAGAKQQWAQDRSSWYWSRRNSDTDITSLVSVTVGVALLDVLRGATKKRKSVIL